ncbi:MAG: LuxR C-terminal-related transcriptional regulator [Polyangiales bacterium]
MTEAAYDLQVAEEDWFPNVIDAAAVLIDHGLGVAGLSGTKPEGNGPMQVEELHVATGPADFPIRLMRAMAELPSESLRQATQSGIGVLSELNAEEPRFLDAWRRHIDYAQDGIGITALDPNGRGVHIIAPVPGATSLSRAERNRWQMLAAHLSSGLRLRGALADSSSGSRSAGADLPCGAQALLDANTFQVTEAVDDARLPGSLQALREAAIRMDRARGPLRKSDTEEALKIWWALLQGRWSMVEWFDTDQRRYILAVPNAPSVVDPRGLTQRESQVVAYAALGESSKLIAYRLGISRSRTSNALSSAMLKLGVKTQPQLVAKLHAIRDQVPQKVSRTI